MNIKTSEHIDIYILPDSAKCELTGKSPSDMNECPSCEFDDEDLCIPENCIYYTE